MGFSTALIRLVLLVVQFAPTITCGLVGSRLFLGRVMMMMLMDDVVLYVFAWNLH